MGLIRKQIGSESPRRQVDEWFVKYAHHKAMSGVFYYPGEALLKVRENYSYVMANLIGLYLNNELNKFVVFDFCNYSNVTINSKCSGVENDIAGVISQMDKHLLNLNEVVVIEGDFVSTDLSTFTIKRYGDGDWRVEPD